MEKLGLLHTVSRLAPTFAELADELLPGVETVVIADELLLKLTVRDGFVGPATAERLRQHVIWLAEYGVNAVLATCSSIGAVIDEIAISADVPVFRVDRPMAERAVMSGSTIGVLATLGTTLGPTTDLVTDSARVLGRTVDVIPRLCSEAFAALERGDAQRHDAILAQELDRLVEQVDVVVLAQASMARIAAARPASDTPVLSSPRLAMEHLAGLGVGVS
jgi:glutamate racemase